MTVLVYAFVSNFYQTEIAYQRNIFTSAEQAFQWKKAKHNKDGYVAERIRDIDDPYTIKKIGEEVSVVHSWRIIEEETLHEIVKQ